jgi:citrate lyase subunit beta/citryl-CoA lyase
MRSMLFVPGDSPRKFARARTGAADALILDLEDSVAADGKAAARGTVLEMLDGTRERQSVYVRVNALDTGMTLADLAAVMPGRPDGIVLPKSEGAADVRQLGAWLDAFEAAFSLQPGSTGIVSIATETARALFGLSSYAEAGDRLRGLMWGAEDLSASLGAASNRTGRQFHSPFVLARDLCLAGAAAAGVLAIDTVFVDVEDIEGLAAEARDACRDGFGAKAVIHPKHVDPVNAAFTPDAASLEWARQVVALFTGSVGVKTLDGKMIDKPHLRVAERILARAGSTEKA